MLGKQPLGRQRGISTTLFPWLWGRGCRAAKAAGGCFFGGIPVSQGLRDAPAGGHIFSGPHSSGSLKESSPKPFFWGRRQGLAKMDPVCDPWDPREVLMQLHWSEICRVAAWKRGHPYVCPTADSRQLLQYSLWLPKPWPTRFIIPKPQLIYLLSIWNIQAPLYRQGSQSEISRLKKHFISVLSSEIKYLTHIFEFIYHFSFPIPQN